MADIGEPAGVLLAGGTTTTAKWDLFEQNAERAYGERAGTQADRAPAGRVGQIYKAIPKVMQEVGAVEKGRKNVQQGYQFRGIDDLYAAVQLVLAKHGVFVVPEVLRDTIVWNERASKSGGTLLHLRVVIRHRFYAGDGSSVYADTFGEAMDSGDKACNKAMSGAMKYALIEALCIPTRDPKDPEDDSPELAAPAAAPPAAQAALDQAEVMADLIGRVRSLTLKHPPDGMGMAPEHARRWLQKYFGRESPNGLTESQAHDAVLLLMTRIRTPELYPAKLEMFHSEGRVLSSEYTK